MNLTSTEYFEALRAARDFLRHVCGYEYRHNDDETFRGERLNETETLLSARVEKQLRTLNPGLSESAARRALNQLQQPQQTDLAFAQQHVHARLTQPEAANPVRYFDFDQPARNDFLVVEQFRVVNASISHTCDLAIFVNGIPLALVAVGASNSKEGVTAGMTRLAQLRTALPKLFHTAQIFLSVQKNFSGVGAANAREESFRSWDDPFPLTWDEVRGALRQIPQRASELPTEQDIALVGVLSPRVLLDLFKNFMLFEHGTPRLAWSQQYHAVRKILDSAQSPGIIWHPGNSGKAYTLAWLVTQLRGSPALASARLLLVTDCEKQRVLLRSALRQQRMEAPVEISETGMLESVLRHKPATTALLPREVVRAILDHAAKPETKLQISATPLLFVFDETAGDLALGELQAAFPQARVLGCTAHPPARAASEQLVHFLTYAQAQRQGYLLPARFEVRLPRLHQQLTAVTAPRTSTLPFDLNLRRIVALAEDLQEHFTQEIRSNGGKALVLASNAQEAAWYYEALEKKMAARVAVLLHKPPPQERELAALYRRFEDHEKIVQRWHDHKDELALLLLAGPLREELRAPQVQAVYVDRELRGYELLRALATTQMPGSSQKHFGLLVDYFGVSKFLEEELRRFDFQQTEPVLAPRFAENAFEELRLWRRELRAIFNAYPHEDNFEAWLFALEPAEPRRAFHRTWQGYAKALDQLLPSLQTEHGLLQEALWFDRVRQEAASFYFDKILLEAQGSTKVRQMLENAARTYGARRVREAARITSADFMSELEALSSRQAQVLRLQYALLEEVRQNLERDPIFYQALRQRVTKATVERQQKQIDDETALQRLREEALRLRQGGRLALDSEAQLAPEAQAYWRVLVRYLAPPESEHGRYQELATRLLATLEPDTKIVDWILKEDWQREMRRKIKHLLREVSCPQDLLDPLTQAVMQLTKARFA